MTSQQTCLLPSQPDASEWASFCSPSETDPLLRAIDDGDVDATLGIK